MGSPPNRRRFLATLATVAGAGLAGCRAPGTPGGDGSTAGDGDQGTGAGDGAGTGDGGDGTSPPSSGDGSDGSADGSRPPLPEAVGLETLTTGLRAPTAIAFDPDGDRGYVTDQPGRVFVHEAGTVRSEPLLDLTDVVETGSEKGVLGIALHPDFAENRRLYVRYSAPRRPGAPSGYSHTFVLAEFTAAADGRRADRGTERSVLEIDQPQANHNSGSITFGPDGYLYVGVGDGGGAADQGRGHARDWYGRVGGGNGQDVRRNLLGSVLRIDVDGRDGERGYAVPEDNPLVGRPGRDEHYAWGLRNPWGTSFDGEDLYVADVGQNRFEEVNVVRRGGNYGWNVWEGRHCFRANDCPSATPEDVRGGERLREPIVEYPHSGSGVSGISVIGGAVYRGSAVPGLEGRYVFGDLRAGGRLFVATPTGDGGQWSTAVLPVTDRDARHLEQLLSFGRGPDGELYVLTRGRDGGGIHRLVPA